ncbi:MAG: cell division protein ZapA [Zoogloeaceae bacterium]|nr:cell division protein ZapA [Zoogloeaceae bacterium]
MEALDIRLLGKEYRVNVTPEDRDALQEAVRLLGDKLTEVAARTQSGGERLLVMTALNIAHEFIQFQRQGGVDLQASKRRIDSMNSRLEGVLAQQERLF